jgi:hypothetical protein
MSRLTVTGLARFYSITEPSTYKHESVNTISQEVQFSATVKKKKKKKAKTLCPSIGFRYSGTGHKVSCVLSTP